MCFIPMRWKLYRLCVYTYSHLTKRNMGTFWCLKWSKVFKADSQCSKPLVRSSERASDRANTYCPEFVISLSMLIWFLWRNCHWIKYLFLENKITKNTSSIWIQWWSCNKLVLLLSLLECAKSLLGPKWSYNITR